MSILKYIPEILKKVQHLAPLKLQKAPTKHAVSIYGAKIQCAKVEENNKLITLELDKKYIQQAVWIILYYVTALDSTCLITLSDLTAV